MKKVLLLLSFAIVASINVYALDYDSVGSDPKLTCHVYLKPEACFNKESDKFCYRATASFKAEGYSSETKYYIVIRPIDFSHGRRYSIHVDQIGGDSKRCDNVFESKEDAISFWIKNDIGSCPYSYL